MAGALSASDPVNRGDKYGLGLGAIWVSLSAVTRHKQNYLTLRIL